jgi:RecA/RadA recombinase
MAKSTTVVKSSLRDKLLKNSTIAQTSVLSDSMFFKDKEFIPTSIPGINIALSGDVDGGISTGLTMVAGPSKHFKTGFSLVACSAFLKKYPNGTILFYDSEFGTPESYFNSFGIPGESVVHTPITDVEELRHDLSVQLEGIERTDQVMIIVDSIGNLASRKEIDDALEGSSKADFTRAKTLKSLFRIVVPKLTMKNIPMFVVNHTYKEMSLFPRDIVSGGTGAYYGADNIWIVGRQQDKDSGSKEINGYNFVINIEKSRYVKEKSKIPINVTYENGINKWSGLFDMAVEGGFIGSTKKGYYARINSDGEVVGKECKESELEIDSDFWNAIMEETDFKSWVKNKYTLAHGAIMKEAD